MFSTPEGPPRDPGAQREADPTAEGRQEATAAAVVADGLAAVRFARLGSVGDRADRTAPDARAARPNPEALVGSRSTLGCGSGVAADKELHDGVAIDRLSCPRFLANQARLRPYAAAYVLYQELRHAAAGADHARAQASTQRERLSKLAGWFERAKRHLVLPLPQDAPWRHGWARITNRLHATVQPPTNANPPGHAPTATPTPPKHTISPRRSPTTSETPTQKPRTSLTAKTHE